MREASLSPTLSFHYFLYILTYFLTTMSFILQHCLIGLFFCKFLCYYILFKINYSSVLSLNQGESLNCVAHGWMSARHVLVALAKARILLFEDAELKVKKGRYYQVQKALQCVTMLQTSRHSCYDVRVRVREIECSKVPNL